MLWFDVGNERYTTMDSTITSTLWLWFDVGNERYTTYDSQLQPVLKLWFDVGNERYTTRLRLRGLARSCGLM